MNSPHIVRKSSSPSSAPVEAGIHWINTTTKEEYFSVGTSSINDWIKRGTTNTADALVTTVWNQTGSSIPAFSVVYINGSQGTLPTVALSQANSEAASTGTYGITTASIANNAQGTVVAFGLLENVNTNSFTDGDKLWLSPTVAGGVTTTKPVAPNHSVFIGTVTRAHPSLGRVEVKIANGYELEELHNVLITTPANNQVLSYDSATSLWKNTTPNAGTVTAVSVASSNGFAGSVANASTTPTITLSTSVSGILKGNGTSISSATSGTDYEPPVTKGNLTESTSSVLTVTGGTGSVIGSGTTIQVKKASATQDGYLGSSDWTTFNNKQNAITGAASTITTTDLTQNRVLLSDASGKVSASTVNNVTLGYLDASSSIQTQLNSKQATITGAASTITTANLTASKALVSDGSGKVVASSVASSTLDFLDATSSVQTQLNSKTSLGSSAPSNVSSAGSVGIATDAARSDHAHRGISSFSKNGSSQLFGDVTISAGTGVTLTQSGQDISIASTGGGSGTVTDVSVVSSNGFAGTVANSTTTPAITLSTTVTGLLKGNGTAISAASSGTDYEPPVTKGNLTEATSSVLTISGGTGSVIGSGTSIQVKQASSIQDGYLSSANWTTFNNKEPAVTKGNLTEATSSVLTITGGTSAVIGSGTSIQVKQADTTQAGYISTNDYRDFFDKLPLNYIDYSARVRMGSTAFIGSSSQSASVSGNQVANSYSSSSLIGKLPHITHVSISTAGSNCGYRMGNNVTYNLQNIGGGFNFSHIFMINDASSVANARNFVGMNTSSVAVAINTTTSTDPFRATFTNFFAMGYDGFIDANFKIFHNAGSAGSTTTIDLGSGFSITPAADVFQVTFINIKNTNDLYYDVIGLISGNRAFGKITSNLPTSSALYQHTTRSNGGSTAVVTYETGGMLLYQTN